MSNYANAAAQAARDYAAAVVNESGYGIAAVTAFAAIDAAMDAGMNRTDACNAVAEYYGGALARLGKPQKVGGTKVGQLGNAYHDVVTHGYGEDAVDLIGAVYQARVGKVTGGVKTILAALAESKGHGEAEAVDAIRALPKDGGKSKGPLTVAQVGKMLETIAAAEWSESDGQKVLALLKQAALDFAAAER